MTWQKYCTTSGNWIFPIFQLSMFSKWYFFTEALYSKYCQWPARKSAIKNSNIVHSYSSLSWSLNQSVWCLSTWYCPHLMEFTSFGWNSDAFSKIGRLFSKAFIIYPYNQERKIVKEIIFFAICHYKIPDESFSWDPVSIKVFGTTIDVPLLRGSVAVTVDRL